jgi:hypothetical protein
MKQIEYYKRLLDKEKNLPVLTDDEAISHINRLFGFEKRYIRIIRSIGINQLRFPMYLNEKENYLLFQVNKHVWEIVNGCINQIELEG